MEFTLIDQVGHATTVIICPHEVTFILGTCNEFEGANQHDAEITYQSSDLLDEISNLKPAEDGFFCVAVHGDTVVTIRRHTPEDGDFDFETVELQVGGPLRHGASLCLSMTWFRALLTGAAVVPPAKTSTMTATHGT